MGTIKILNDTNYKWKSDSIVSVMDFISEYCRMTSDKAVVSWLQRIPMPCAVDYIAKNLGIEFKYI